MSKIIGLDVSKQWLDICVYNTSDKPKYHRFANDAAGHEEVIKLVKEQEIKLIICEPTGGYEAEICQKLYNNKQQIHKVNTYSFNSFSKSVNLCKTDRKDAFKLAYYGDKMQLSANYIYQVESENLKRYKQRREDLVLMLSNEKKRLHHSIDGIDKDSIEKHIKFLQNEIAELDKKLNKTIDESEELKEKVKILETVPGIGKCLATKLISFVPELGDKNYSSNELSAIVGIAPYARDSGNKQGRRFIRGGRKIPRDALYMAVLTGKNGFQYLKTLYNRLVNNFKPKKVAIVACMRKLLEVCHKLIQQKRCFII
ncbi:IS110 family RNA-guided transposase [Rickettsia endosymbiont of Oedothorax gibbosus]|uniref:IS110 family transposase n=1 Tax=Rickettsia endosymbiont of Oedothorax gibbosus TaxID=931099 RepID=UPI002023BEF2|nr:IS110 family transposase [Rickettsia endosymbiont of Oedothorax gibbosus]